MISILFPDNKDDERTFPLFYCFTFFLPVVVSNGIALGHLSQIEENLLRVSCLELRAFTGTQIIGWLFAARIYPELS